ncbi:MAG: DUF924 domain-containing protein [Gammaproteobacteria bacterium]|jgi:uncharacterized protein (DUF924 family)
MINPDNILEFWFADACESPAAARRRSDFWFTPNPELDGLIWEEYADAVTDAANYHYDDWASTAAGRLALIILLDQFPRNIFRGTAEVFRHDARALQLAQQGVATGQLAGLAIPEQAFMLMPYQHSEDLAIQDAGVGLYGAMLSAAPLEWKEVAAGYRDFAARHRDIIAEYGRFPHRNSVLGRSATEAESRFLAEGGESFGQSG